MTSMPSTGALDALSAVRRRGSHALRILQGRHLSLNSSNFLNLNPPTRDQVLVYRAEDQMLICQLPFGKPRARLYIPLSVPMQLERANEDAERIGMEREEEALKGYYAWERGLRRAEYLQMSHEERTLRDHFRRQAPLRIEAVHATATLRSRQFTEIGARSRTYSFSAQSHFNKRRFDAAAAEGFKF